MWKIGNNSSAKQKKKEKNLFTPFKATYKNTQQKSKWFTCRVKPLGTISNKGCNS
jgi:hypothetical protein